MTLRKKIVLLNILTVILPIVLILAVWAGYIHWGNGAGLKPINRSADKLLGGENVMGYCTWAGTNEANRIYHDTEWGAAHPVDGRLAPTVAERRHPSA